MNSIIDRVMDLQKDFKKDPEATINTLKDRAMEKLAEHMPSTRAESPEPAGPESPIVASGKKTAKDKTDNKTNKLLEPEPVGYKIKLKGKFIENQSGQHVFLFNAVKKGRGTRAGVVSITIPDGRNPSAFQYEDPVEIVIKKVAPDAEEAS